MLNQIDANRNNLSSSSKICILKYNKHLLKEGDEVIINTKLHKVEGCQLQRAYQACGTHLWFVINIVCGAIESQGGENTRYKRFRRFTHKKLLTEACCQSTCTINEMTRYCP